MTIVFMQFCAVAGLLMQAQGLDNRGLIEQALDERTEFTLDNIKLSDAIERLTEQTGVPLVMAPDVMKLAPLGGQTIVTEVEIANISLRDGLTRLFAPLGMTFVVRDDHVEIVPKDALLALGRPPTWAELDTLGELSAMHPGVDARALGQLRRRCQFRVASADPWSALAEAVQSVGAGSGDSVLTAACDRLGWAWSLSDKQILIVSMERQIQRLLQQPITLRLTNRVLFDVMTAVGEQVHVSVRAEPGALVSLPIHMQQNFSLTVHHQTAEQTLEKIAAYTGLGYFIDHQGVVFYQAGGGERSSSKGGPTAWGGRPQREGSQSSDPYVGKMVIPLEDGKTLEWFIRRSDIPADLRQMRQADLEELFEILRSRAPQVAP